MTTVIEAGHYYEVHGPSSLSLLGWEIGKKLIAELNADSLVLFIDDYHQMQYFEEPGDTFLGSSVAHEEAAIMQSEADIVYMESVFAAQALANVTELLEAGGLVKKRGDSITANGARLGTITANDLGTFVPTCTFLDYLFLCEKANHGENQIVVLPEIYQHQQDQLDRVVQKIGVHGLSSYLPILFDIDGRLL